MGFGCFSESKFANGSDGDLVKFGDRAAMSGGHPEKERGSRRWQNNGVQK